ncbi:hypothetical protein D3C76_1586370 [compost metagenome]
MLSDLPLTVPWISIWYLPLLAGLPSLSLPSHSKATLPFCSPSMANSLMTWPLASFTVTLRLLAPSPVATMPEMTPSFSR